MNSRERVAKILKHEEADRVPIDFGSTMTTGITASMVYRIKKYYGLLEEGERIKVVEPYQVLGEIDAKLRDFLGLDVVGVFGLKNMFGFENKDWKEWELFDGTPVLVPGDFNTKPDANGDIPMWAGGDRSYEPSAIMPKGGFYFDSIIRQKPFDEDNPNWRDNTEEFVVLADEEVSYLANEVNEAYENTDCAIAISIPAAGFGDIAFVPGPFMKDPKGIRDITEWYMSIALRPEFMKKVFEYQSEIAIENLRRIYKAVGEKVQMAFMSGADFGSQSGPMISAKTYAEIYLPYQKKLNDWVHENTGWKTFIHSCGSVEPLLEVIIEAGYDILNPVQCSAANMEPSMLKSKYGERLVFWGGGVDTQKTLPFGKAEEVHKEVSERVEVFKKDGGFMFNTIHNLQSGVPAENFAAMMDAYKAHRDY